jgi:predicted secreted protein
MPQAENSVGAILRIGVTAVGKLTKIGTPEMTKGEIDVTTLDSTGGYKEFISDFRDGGSLTFEGFAISDAGQDALKDNFDADENEQFTIELPNGTTITFNGYVSKYKKGDAGVGQALTFSGEIRVSGVVEYAESASTGCSAITFENAGDDTTLNNLTLAPTFAIGKYYYSATFDTDSSVQIKATNATANTTIHLYIDGEFIEELTTAVASSHLTYANGDTHLYEIVTWQTDKTPLIYRIMLARAD